MTREQTIEIEQAVRRVLSGILGEAPDELRGRGAGKQPPTPAPPGGGPDEPAAIPPAVLTQV
ncbi:MAG: hypothetical protein M3461_19785 [Pseudomonadota bacterium]|nr:hypothetical protein [Pseudomonadota bacterium]